jgi:hypothetical protein
VAGKITKITIAIAAAAIILCSSVYAELLRHPIGVGTNIGIGQIVKGQLIGDSFADTVSGDGQFLTRTGVYITESATINEKLTITMTMGGLFWYALPEQTDLPPFRFLQFGPGVGEAQAIYAFGDPENPWSKLQFGFFPIKYNSDAKNLGEYLFRSGTYPALLYTGGWSYLNAAAYMAQGIRYTLNTLGGTLVHDFTLTMERDLEPNYDLSPGYLITWKPLPVFQIGAGVQWAHGIPMNDSLLHPKKPHNAYVVLIRKCLKCITTPQIHVLHLIRVPLLVQLSLIPFPIQLTRP